jgi:hypothetical protein
VPTFAFPAVEVVPIAVHAVDELAQHTCIHPTLRFGSRKKPRLQLIEHAIRFIDLWQHQ